MKQLTNTQEKRFSKQTKYRRLTPLEYDQQPSFWTHLHWKTLPVLIWECQKLTGWKNNRGKMHQIEFTSTAYLQWIEVKTLQTGHTYSEKNRNHQKHSHTNWFVNLWPNVLIKVIFSVWQNLAYIFLLYIFSTF